MRERLDLLLAEGIGNIGHRCNRAARTHARFVVPQRLHEILRALAGDAGNSPWCPRRYRCGMKRSSNETRAGSQMGPKTARPPIGGLSLIACSFAIEENLERAKGLEPSTPTLARSCSTTELHPHPRWRRTLAVNGRPMPNADRECNSPRAIRCRADNPISLTNGSESVRNTPKRGLSARKPNPGTQGQAARVTRGDSEPFFEPAADIPLPIRPARRNRNRRSLDVPWGVPANPVCDDAAGPAD
jgi:hypothetical protein